jgi:hypothetical protein
MMRPRVRRWIAVLTVAVGLLYLGGKLVPGDSPWQPFRWFVADIGSERLERGALLVPVRLDGLTGEHHFQLDLGAGHTMLHERSVREADPSFPLRSGAMTISGTLAGLEGAIVRVEVLADFAATAVQGIPIPVIGTLGLDFFEHRILILDYPGRRFAVLPENAALPENLETRATFLPALHRNGKLYVPVEVDGEAQTGIFFDTGASPFSLVTSPEEWRRLTGLRGDEASNARRTVSSWNTDITLVGSRMLGNVRLGPGMWPRPVIWFTADPRLRFDAWPATTGLLGNELLAERFVVVVDVPRGRIGLAPR